MARGCVTKRGNNWYIKFRLRGKQVMRVIGPRKKEADRALSEVMDAINKGTYRDLPKMTFQAYAEEWLRDYCETAVRPSTRSEYTNWIRKHLIPFFGHMQLSDITPGDVQDYITEKVRERRLKGKSINNSLVVLKRMLRIAVRKGYLRSNPAQEVEKAQVEDPETRALKPEQVRRLLYNVSEAFYPFFLTAVMTGMRLGELLALKWTDIDFERGVVHVRRSVWRGKFGKPKSKRSKRTIPLGQRVLETLRAHRLKVPPNDLDLVFPSQKGTPLDPANMRRREFLPALERAGLPRITFHELRHTCISILMDLGVNPLYVKAKAGHSSITTTLDVYGHLLTGSESVAEEHLYDAVFAGASEPPGSKTVASTLSIVPSPKEEVPETPRASGT